MENKPLAVREFISQLQASKKQLENKLEETQIALEEVLSALAYLEEL